MESSEFSYLGWSWLAKFRFSQRRLRDANDSVGGQDLSLKRMAIIKRVVAEIPLSKLPLFIYANVKRLIPGKMRALYTKRVLFKSQLISRVQSVPKV